MYKKKQTVFRGLENIVIVDSDDALLVAAKGKIQDVKKVAEEIKGRGVELWGYFAIYQGLALVFILVFSLFRYYI